MQHWIAWWPTLMVVAVATFTDLRSRRIPNWLVLPFLAAGVAVSPWRKDWTGAGDGFWPASGHGMGWHGLGRFGWHGLGQSFAGLGLGILIYGALFWVGGMGAGDVKLCAAIGAWIGPSQLFFSLILTSLIGGVMALVWAALGGFLTELFTGTGDLMFDWRKRGMCADPEQTPAKSLKRKMPYAPAIAIGTLLSFFAR